MFVLCFSSLDLIWPNPDSMSENGDYVGFLGDEGGYIIVNLRNALADMVTYTMKYQPGAQKYMAWFVFVLSIYIMTLILMNLIIALIEENYGAVVTKRVEEAYQKKCGVLVELNSVFGKLAKRKNTNILITREVDFATEKGYRFDRHTYNLKKLILVNQINTQREVHELRR